MKIKPEERPKVIALAAAIVLVFCIFGFTVVPRLLPHGPNGELLHNSAPPVVAATPPTAAPAPALSPGVPAPAGATPATGTLAAPSPTATDPFWRPLALSLQPQKTNFAPPRKIVPPPVLTAKPGFAARTGAMKLAPIAPPPMPEVSLQGIVQDETAMAVLTVGGQAKFMKVGEKLDGGWVLIGIQTASVVLRQGRREVVLNLGQTLPRESPLVDHDVREVRGIATTLPPFHSTPLEP